MIRKLEEKDRKSLMEYLSKEPAINLFIIGDVEVFGFDSDFQVLWGDFDDKGELVGVLLRYRENFVPYSQDVDYDWSGFKKIILDKRNELGDKLLISGKKSILDKFDDVLLDFKRKHMYFCEISEDSKLENDGLDDVKIAMPNDAKRVWEVIENIDEFFAINDAELIRKRIEDKTGRIYYIEVDGKMVSISQTTAENSMSAMVVGVATLKEFRGHGYMSKCLSKLCKDILDEGKTLCLFYNNPKAGSVYHRLGFETLDKWSIIAKEK